MDLDTFVELFDTVKGIPVKETIEFFDNVPDEINTIAIVFSIIDDIELISQRDAPIPIEVANSIYKYLYRVELFPADRRQVDIEYLNISIYEIDMDNGYNYYRFVVTCDES